MQGLEEIVVELLKLMMQFILKVQGAKAELQLTLQVQDITAGLTLQVPGAGHLYRFEEHHNRVRKLKSSNSVKAEHIWAG